MDPLDRGNGTCHPEWRRRHYVGGERKTLRQTLYHPALDPYPAAHGNLEPWKPMPCDRERGHKTHTAPCGLDHTIFHRCHGVAAPSPFPPRRWLLTALTQYAIGHNFGGSASCLHLCEVGRLPARSYACTLLTNEHSMAVDNASRAFRRADPHEAILSPCVHLVLALSIPALWRRPTRAPSMSINIPENSREVHLYDARLEDIQRTRLRSTLRGRARESLERYECDSPPSWPKTGIKEVEQRQ